MNIGFLFHLYQPIIQEEVTFRKVAGESYLPLVKFLKDRGIKVEAYGLGWPNGVVSFDKLVEIYSRSKIALSFSDSWGIGKFDLPGRDFEVPLIGSLYMNESNEKIANYYVPDKEIVLYKDRDDLVEKIKYYLEHDEERDMIAKAGRERALRDHTWEKRFDYIFKIMELI